MTWSLTLPALNPRTPSLGPHRAGGVLRDSLRNDSPFSVPSLCSIFEMQVEQTGVSEIVDSCSLWTPKKMRLGLGRTRPRRWEPGQADGTQVS